jgi:hypothetical protein
MEPNLTPAPDSSNAPQPSSNPSSPEAPAAQPPIAQPPIAQPPVAPPDAGSDSAASYISNPFALIAPSIKAIKVNIGAVLAVVAAVVVVMIAAVMLGFGATFFGRTSTGATGLGLASILLFILLLVALIALVAYMYIVFLASAKGEKITVIAAAKQSPQYALRIIGISLLTVLAVIGGFLLLIIPGLIFLAWFSLAPYVAINENLGVMASMSRSKQLVKGHVIEMLGLFGLGSAVSLLQLIPIIGPLASALLNIVVAPAAAIRYLQLLALQSSGTPAPSIHPANYAAIVLAIIATPLVASQQNRTSIPADQADLQRQLQELESQTNQDAGFTTPEQ